MRISPAWIGVGDIDLFHDENADYARRLRDAGVDCELDIVPGAPHGFESWASKSPISEGFVARARDWLGRTTAARNGSVNQ
ncbi:MULTISPECIES: alpha/beta hydrolase [unclassified Amycolatopsis]|uniref:alpha/beta hydrolase n=1 Tax=unclassified Amycolatopsis TaxID=2618356 RepID=UPI001F178194|nr:MULTISPECIES: alpha/beta hydrolase fold domain-containing protein [unclassified Amycolatopsis]